MSAAPRVLPVRHRSVLTLWTVPAFALAASAAAAGAQRTTALSAVALSAPPPAAESSRPLLVANGTSPKPGYPARALVGAMPGGWKALEGSSRDYVLGTDVAPRFGGEGLPGATIRSTTDAPDGAAALAQSIRADDYRGKRVRLSGFLRLRGDAAASSALWMRVDGEGVVQTADFMEDRALHGPTDWTRVAVVLDVPRTAVGLTYGFMLDGGGQVWLDDLALEVVGPTVPVTTPVTRVSYIPTSSTPAALRARRRAQQDAYARTPLEPVNLGFDLSTDAGR